MFSPAPILLERLARLLQNDAHTGGLKPTQWEALRFIARANRFSCSPSALTAYLGMTKGTVSQTLQALERKGLIKKATTKGDRRAVSLDLTKAGAALLSEDPLGVLDATIAKMPHEARETLGACVEELLKTLLARQGGRVFGTCKACRHFREDRSRGAQHFCNLLQVPLSRDDSEQICVEQEEAT